MSEPTKAQQWLSDDVTDNVQRVYQWGVRQVQLIRSGTDRRLLRKLGVTSMEVVELRDEAVPEIVTAFVKLYLAEQMLRDQPTAFPFAEYQRNVSRAVRLMNRGGAKESDNG